MVVVNVKDCDSSARRRLEFFFRGEFETAYAASSCETSDCTSISVTLALANNSKIWYPELTLLLFWIGDIAKISSV